MNWRPWTWGSRGAAAVAAAPAAAAPAAAAPAAAAVSHVHSATRKQLGKLGGDFSGAWDGVKHASSRLFSTTRDSAGRFTGFAFRMADATGKWTVRAARVPVKAVGGIYNSRLFGPAALLATVFGGAVLVGGWVRGRAQRRTEREALNQIAAVDMAQAQANTYAQQPAYTLQPGEHEALVEPRLKRAGELAAEVQARAAQEAAAGANR